MRAATHVAARGVHQIGLALIAVLWIVAALTITVTGIVYAVRGEVQSVSSFKEISTAGALTDAGVVLAARELAASRGQDGALRRYEASIEGQVIRVQVMPLTGLIDLNAAQEPLLTDLIAVAGGVDRDRATVLAQRIIDWRDPDDQPLPLGAENPAYIAANSPFRTRGGPFEAQEDLLQVLGVDFDLYVKLRGLVTVHQRGGGRVNPASAPLSVLRVLAGGNEQLAIEYASARDASGVLADSTRFPAAYVAQVPTSRFLVEASMRLSNGASLVTRKVLDVAGREDGVPWLTLQAERVVVESDQAT